MRYSKIILIMIAVITIIGAAIIYYLYEPQSHGFFLVCPLYYLTGIKCPLCGLQQMIHFLLHGQLRNAFLANPYLFVLIPYVGIYFYLVVFKKKEKHEQLYKKLYGDKILLTLLIIGLIFGVVRNFI